MVREKRNRPKDLSGGGAGSVSVFTMLERMDLPSVQAEAGQRLPQELLGDIKLSSPSSKGSKKNLKPLTGAAGSPMTNRSPAAIMSAGRAAVGAPDGADSKLQHASSWGRFFAHPPSTSALAAPKLESLTPKEEHELHAKVRQLQQEVERQKKRADVAEAALQGERRDHEQDALEARMRSVLSEANR